mgnify:CR=1 FL=1
MSFEQTLMYFAAPALCGLKSANLISAKPAASSAQILSQWNKELSPSGKRIVLIRRSKSLNLLFVYDKNILYQTLSGSSQILYLKQKGYPVAKGMDALLAELFHRLACQPSFPHEIGLFLGYPLEDVICFEKDGGRMSKYSGMWQVYGNVEEARRQMQLYRQCSANCRNYLDMGMNIPYISTHYKSIVTGGIGQ